MMSRVSGVSGSRHTRMRVAARNSPNCPPPAKQRTPSICFGVRLQPSVGKSNCATALATRSPSTPSTITPTGKSARTSGLRKVHSPRAMSAWGAPGCHSSTVAPGKAARRPASQGSGLGPGEQKVTRIVWSVHCGAASRQCSIILLPTSDVSGAPRFS